MIPCPPPEALRHLLDGDLPESSASSLRDHLEACRPCLDTMDRLTDDPRPRLVDRGRAGPGRRSVAPGEAGGKPTDARTLGPVARPL